MDQIVEVKKMAEKKDKRSFYLTKTFWACALLFIGGGLEALGVVGSLEVVQKLAVALGASGGVYSVADRLRK